MNHSIVVITLASLATGACVYDESLGRAIAPQQEEGALVVTSSNDSITIAAGYKTRMLEILAGDSPTDFEWFEFSFPASRQDELYATGVHLDYADASANATFRNASGGPCNPALEDFSHCILLEHMMSGEEGASGVADFRVSANVLTFTYEVTIDHVTDKYGDPLQWNGSTFGSAVNVMSVITPLSDLEPSPVGR